MQNEDLQKVYDKVYKNDSTQFYSFNTFSESKLIIEMLSTWDGLEVLEIGCGEGRLAAMMSFAGAKTVEAIDYSQEAIDIARSRINLENVRYQCADYHNVQGQYDVVVLQGVLEHFDDPFVELKYILDTLVKNGGTLITSSPSFLNPRGYVWMTLQLLFDVPMSLTDLHFLCPFDFERYARENNLWLELRSIDSEKGSGERLVVDFQKRLPNALKDAGMDNSKVDLFLEWLSHATQYFQNDEFSGATVAYKLSRKNDSRIHQS